MNLSDNTVSDSKISILIRTKNGDRYLEKTLTSIFSQTYKDYEVLIVDSGSTDTTLQILRKYPVKIYEIKPEDFTWGYSLNYGFQRAKGEYVICLSQDATPVSENWLTIIINNIDDDSVGAFMCNNVPWPDCNPFDRRGLLKKFSIPKQEIFGGPPYIFGNYCSVIKKSVWEEIPFDETLSFAEDHDWAQKATKAGYKIMYIPEAEVYHSHNDSLKQIYKRFFSEAKARRVLNYEKHSIASIFYDFAVGSLYDMLYVVYKRDNIKWLFFAPLRKIVVNYARFKAMRAVDRGGS